MNLQKTNIAFIGAGNMASALIQGLLANDISPSKLWASDPDEDKLRSISAKTGINVTSSNIDAIEQANVLILAVKPQVMATVLRPLQQSLKKQNCLLISIAAGIGLDSLEQWTSSKQAIIRCMPNTPALVLAGASALIANENTSQHQIALAEAILSSVGSVCWLTKESDINAVTALSGSGPAYFFLLMEAMQEAAIKLGLPAETAKQLCLQTAFGAAKLAQNSEVNVDELRRRVTSPGGTTEAALQQFDSDNFKHIVDNALIKAAAKSEQLAKDLGKI